MKVVVLGARGLLGSALCATPSTGSTVVPLTRSDADIRDSSALAAKLRATRPAWVINATAYTDVDGAEREPDVATAVNATAVGEIARLCRELGAGIVHVSTDYVFAGDRDSCYSEDDAVAPVNAYGASKEAGEQLVRESGAPHLIVRTQWVYGQAGRAFLSTLAARARDRVPLRVVDDEYGCCTYASDLATVIWGLLDKPEGTYHVANRGRVSRFDVAKRVYEKLGAADLVTAAHSADVPMTAKRPRSSQLCVEKVEQVLGQPMAWWTDALDRYLASLR